MSEKTEELHPTSAADWPTGGTVKDGIVVELPSGAVARLSRPPLQYFIATGRVPTKLWAKVQKQGAQMFEDPLNAMSKEELTVFIDWMLSCAFVEPKVTMTRKDGCVYIGDLDERDKEEVMQLLGLSLRG
jgi:hypothetical protein